MVIQHSLLGVNEKKSTFNVNPNRIMIQTCIRIPYDRRIIVNDITIPIKETKCATWMNFRHYILQVCNEEEKIKNKNKNKKYRELKENKRRQYRLLKCFLERKSSSQARFLSIEVQMYTSVCVYSQRAKKEEGWNAQTQEKQKVRCIFFSPLVFFMHLP